MRLWLSKAQVCFRAGVRCSCRGSLCGMSAKYCLPRRAGHPYSVTPHCCHDIFSSRGRHSLLPRQASPRSLRGCLLAAPTRSRVVDWSRGVSDLVADQLEVLSAAVGLCLHSLSPEELMHCTVKTAADCLGRQRICVAILCEDPLKFF